MRWIVDGMNLIGARPDGWWRDRPAAHRRLVGELAAFAGRRDSAEVAVVFDGDAPGEGGDAPGEGGGAPGEGGGAPGEGGGAPGEGGGAPGEGGGAPGEGGGAPARAVPVSVSYAGRGANAADRRIVETVGSDPDPSGLTVVTSDAALRDQVQALGATVVGVSAFRRLLDSPGPGGR